MNLADIMAMAFMAESAFLRVKKLSEKPGTDKVALDIKTKLAQLYLTMPWILPAKRPIMLLTVLPMVFKKAC